MKRDDVNRKKSSFAYRADSLWRITLAGSIWAIHFSICYAATAIVCAKWPASPTAVLQLRVAIGLATAGALISLLYVAYRSWVRWNYLDDYNYEHELNRDQDRHEFLGHVSFLLCIVSFIGVSYVALPVLVLEACR